MIRHTRYRLVTGVQTCALPILAAGPTGGLVAESIGFRAAFWAAAAIVLVSLALTSTLPQRRPHGELTRKRLITAIGRVPSAEVDPGIVCAARKDSRNVRRANAGDHGQPGGSRRLVMCLYGEGGLNSSSGLGASN
jgi:hypothetical protein